MTSSLSAVKSLTLMQATICLTKKSFNDELAGNSSPASSLTKCPMWGQSWQQAQVKFLTFLSWLWKNVCRRVLQNEVERICIQKFGLLYHSRPKLSFQFRVRLQRESIVWHPSKRTKTAPGASAGKVLRMARREN